MTRQADWVERQRRDAWVGGRAHRDSLLSEFCRRYRLKEPPAPALIADDIISDFLNADLRYDPLPLDIFAQTEAIDGSLTVTINSRIKDMPGIVDHEGVANVAKWHEIEHLVKDAPTLLMQRPLPLDGFDAPRLIVCHRGLHDLVGGPVAAREFRAEEGGRAAAVSHRALAQSAAFRQLRTLSGRVPGPMGWELLAQAAADIGVNRSALTRQLSYEGRIAVVREDGRAVLYVQPALREQGSS